MIQSPYIPEHVKALSLRLIEKNLKNYDFSDNFRRSKS